MDNLNDLRAIWLTAKTNSLPDSAEMKRIVKSFRDKKLFRLIVLVAFALILIAVMVWVIFVYHSKMMTTQIGEVMMIIAALILVITNSNSINRFLKLKECSNKDYIKFLEQTRLRQRFYQQRTQVIAMLFCFIGMMLYLYEGVYLNRRLLLIAYPATIIYFAVLWLVVRPRIIKKDARKLDEERDKIQRVSNQLKTIENEK